MRKDNALSKRIYFLAFSVATALTAVLILGGCNRDTVAGSPIAPVRVAMVSTSGIAEGIRYSANIVADSQVNLAFKAGGYVENIGQRKGADGEMRPLQAGDSVEMGEVLASIRKSDYTEKVAQAKAQIAQVSASLQKSQLDYQRASNLFSSQSATKAQLDAATAYRDADMASLDNAKAILAQAETALNDCTLRSPMKGRVVERQIEIGSFASTGSTAFVIDDTRTVKAVFGLPDTMIDRVHLGDRQNMTTVSVPGGFLGRVTSISPAADPKSRVFSVEVSIPNADNRLKAGMIGTLALAGVKAAQAVMVVPLSAVVRSSKTPGGFAVFVVDQSGGRAIVHERDLKVGDTVGNSIAVVQGLQLGEQVVSVGATEIKDGDQVRILL